MEVKAWSMRRTSHTKNRGKGIPSSKNVICKSFEVTPELGVFQELRERRRGRTRVRKGRSTRWGWRRRQEPDHVDLCWQGEALDFILHAHKSALADFKQKRVTRTHLPIQQIFTEHFDCLGPETHSAHRARHVLGIQQVLVSSPFQENFQSVVSQNSWENMH